jgi:hypothetical protein
MTAEIHDMVAAGDKVAIRATYRGTDKGGFNPNMPATGKSFEMQAIYMVRIAEVGTRPGRRSAGGCRMPPFLIQDPSRVGRLRRRLRLIPGVRQPAAPPADAGLLQARRSRHLVRADGYASLLL